MPLCNTHNRIHTYYVACGALYVGKQKRRRKRTSHILYFYNITVGMSRILWSFKTYSPSACTTDEVFSPTFCGTANAQCRMCQRGQYRNVIDALSSSRFALSISSFFLFLKIYICVTFHWLSYYGMLWITMSKKNGIICVLQRICTQMTSR